MRMETVSRVFHRGVEKIKNAMLPCISVFLGGSVLCGCVTTHASAPLAPPPPQVAYQEGYDGTLMTAVFFAESSPQYAYNFTPPVAVGQGVEAALYAPRPELAGLPAGLGYERERVALSAGAAEHDCSISDRFDRGEVLAYEWDRSRLGLNVDGINMDGDGEQAVKVSYTMRLQPEKSPEQRCRYPSAWQGMAGSAYNELVKREDNTVWDQLKQARRSFENMF